MEISLVVPVICCQSENRSIYKEAVCVKWESQQSDRQQIERQQSERQGAASIAHLFSPIVSLSPHAQIATALKSILFTACTTRVQ